MSRHVLYSDGGSSRKKPEKFRPKYMGSQAPGPDRSGIKEAQARLDAQRRNGIQTSRERLDWANNSQKKWTGLNDRFSENRGGIYKPRREIDRTFMANVNQFNQIESDLQQKRRNVEELRRMSGGLATKDLQNAIQAFDDARKTYAMAIPTLKGQYEKYQRDISKWQKSARDPKDIQKDLKDLDDRIEQQKKADKSRIMGEFFRTEGGPLQPGAAYDSTMEELQRRRSILQEELNDTNFYKYAELTQREDFAEKSKYAPTNKGFTDSLFYSAVNQDGTWRDAASGIGTFDYGIDQMSDTERGIYNYLHQQSPQEAANYLLYLQSDLGARQRMEDTQKFRDFGKAHPFLATVGSAAMAPSRGVSYIGQAIDMIDGDMMENAGYNDPIYKSDALKQGAGEAAAEEMQRRVKGVANFWGKDLSDETLKNWGKFGEWGYGTAASMAEFLLTTGITGGSSAASLAIMGTSAAADTTVAAKDRGLTDEQAFQLGTIAGAAEVITEKVSLETLLNPELLADGSLKYIIKNTLAEGSEELGSDIINFVADELIAGNQSELTMAAKKYMEQGMTEQEAFDKAVQDQLLQMGADFAGGAVSGAAMGTGGAVMQEINYDQIGDRVRAGWDSRNDYEGLQEVIDAGLLSGDKVAKDAAYHIIDRQAKGRDVSNRLIGRSRAASERVALEWARDKYAEKVEEAKADLHKEAKDMGQHAAAMEQTWVPGQDVQQYSRAYKLAYNMGKAGASEDAVMQQDSLQGLTEEQRRIAYRTGAAEAKKAKANDAAPAFEVSEKKGETFQISTGESLEIKRVAEIKDGKMMLETKSGELVDSSDVSYATEEDAIIYKAVSELGIDADAANKAIESFHKGNGKMTAGEYAEGLRDTYTMGSEHLPEADVKRGLFSGQLAPDLQQSIYRQARANSPTPTTPSFSGRSARAGKVDISRVKTSRGKWSKIQSTSVEHLEKIAEMTGLNFVVYESYSKNGKRYFVDPVTGVEKDSAPNGFFDPNTGKVYIDLHAGNRLQGTMLMTAGHEMTHAIRKGSPEHYNALAEVIKEAYAEKGKSFTDAVAHKMAEQKIDRETATEEVIADSMQDILTNGDVAEFMAEVKMKDAGLAEKIRDWFRKLFESLAAVANAYRGKKADTEEGRFVQEIDGLLDKLRPIFAEGALEAGVNLQVGVAENAIVAENNAIIDGMTAEQKRENADLGDPQTKSNPPMDAKQELAYSIRHDEKYLKSAIKKNETEKKVDPELLTSAGKVRRRVQARMNKMLEEDKVGLPEDIEGNTFLADSSYGGTEENTTICPRSLASEAFVDAVSDMMGRPLTVAEQIQISQFLQGSQLAPEYPYCYVATDRKAYRQFIGEYLNQRDAVIDKLKSGNADTSRYTREWEAFLKKGYNSEKKLPANIKEFQNRHPGKSPYGSLYGEFLAGRKDTKNMWSRFNSWVNLYQKAVKVGGDINEALRNVLVQESELANMQKLIAYSSVKTVADTPDVGIRISGSMKAQVRDAMAYAQSASWAKKRISYVAYNGHILRWKPDRISKLNSHYGLRMYSFSDFSPAFILENMQMITDAAVRGLKMLAYTKDTDFAEIFAPTGININISVFGFQKGDGVEAFENNRIGANWEKAKELRDKYSNVGVVFVATNDFLTGWALKQPWIDVVIPYHLVRTGTEVAKAFNYMNYTAESADKKMSEKQGRVKGDLSSIPPTMHNNDLDTYMKALEDNHLTPRFERWLTKDNGIYKPFYMKLVNECRLPATMSQPVQPVFDTPEQEEAINRSLAKMESEGYYTPVGGTTEKMEDVAWRLAEAMYNGEDVSQIRMENLYEDVRKLSARDQEYLAAVDSGDMEQAQKLVDQAAKAAGYNTPKLLHGTKQFGFTVFERSKVDDGISFFVTPDKDTAQTYSGKYKPMRISELDSAGTFSGKVKAFNEKFRTDVGYIKELTVEEGRERYAPVVDQQIRALMNEIDWRKYRGEKTPLSTSFVDSLKRFSNGHSEEDARKLLENLDNFIGEFTQEELDEMEGAEPIFYDYSKNIRRKVQYFLDGRFAIDETYGYPELVDEERLDSLLDLKSGNYALYGKTENPLIVNARGSWWNEIKVPKISDSLVSTREVARWAKENGFDSVRIKNVKDFGDEGEMPDVPADVYIFFDSERLKSADPVTYDDSGNVIPLSERFQDTQKDIRYSARVTDPNTIGFLEKQSREGKVYHTYRSMQLIDGKLYPPMGARVNGQYEDPSELGKWEESIEHPELVRPDGTFKLDKGKGVGSPVNAAYNPYMHSSNMVLNDQFSSAHKRPNLVTVEVEAPMSEDNGTYHADKAKDATGWHAWHTGTVAGGIRKAKGLERKVYLSRWLKPVRIIPDSEVAQMYKEALSGTDVQIPDNVVPPNLLKELKKIGVPIKESGKVKYSQRDEAITRQLEQQNQSLEEDLKKLRELMKLQRRMGGRLAFPEGKIDSIAKDLRDTAGATMGSVKELSRLLTSLYANVFSDKKTSWDESMAKAEEVAAWIEEHRPQQLMPEAEEVLSFLKGQRFSLNESQKAEAISRMGSLKEFRRAIAGTVILDQNANQTLDELWTNSLADKYPNFFDPTTGDSQQVSSLIDAIEAVKSMEQVESPEYEAYAHQDLLRKIYDSYWDIAANYNVQAKAEKKLETVKAAAAADIAAQKAKIERLKQAHDDAMNTMQTAFAAEMKATKALHKAEVERLNADRRREVHEKTDAVAKKYQEARKKNVEGRKKTALRHKIKQTLKEIDKIFNKGTKKRNVKTGMSDFVAKALQTGEILAAGDITSSILLDTADFSWASEDIQKKIAQARALTTEINKMSSTAVSDEYKAEIAKRVRQRRELMKELEPTFAEERRHMNVTYKAAFTDLAEAYKSLRNSPDAYIAESYNEEVYNRLAQLVEDADGTSLHDMTEAQLEELADAYKMVMSSIRKANELWIDGKVESKEQLTDATNEQLLNNPHRAKDHTGVVGKLESGYRSYSWNMLSPVDAFERLGSRAFESLYWDMIKAQGKYGLLADEVRTFIEDARKRHHYKKMDLKTSHRFQLSDGKIFNLTLEDMMSIYAYTKRDQAALHMEKGGFVFDTGHTYKEGKGKLKKVSRKLTDPYQLSIGDQQMILDEFLQNEDAKAYVDEVQKFVTEFGSNYGNETSNILYGIDLFKEKMYIPLKSQSDYLSSSQEALQQTATTSSLANVGMAKATKPHATNPIVLQGFDELMLQHLDQMAKYAAYAVPIDNIRKVFEAKSNASGRYVSTRAVMSSVFGEEASRYIQQYITDVNGGGTTSGAKNPIAKFFGRSKKVAVALSNAVWIQQYSAIFRSMAEINPAFFHPAPGNKPSAGSLYNELRRYAPVAIIKEMGGFDIGSNRGIANWIGESGAPLSFKKAAEGFDNFSGLAPEMMDRAGWLTIWAAVKNETAHLHKDLKRGSEEFLEIAGRRFTEVVTRTQVYNSVNSRSGFMRSKHDSVQYMTSFMGEPSRVVGMMFTAGNNLIRAIRTGKNQKLYAMQAAKTAGAVAISIVTNAMLKSLVYAMRDDDEDDSYWEKWAKHTGGSIRDDVWFANYLPVFRDLQSIYDGWDVERPDISLAADLITNSKRLIVAIDKGEDTPELYLKVAGDLGNACGLPLKNIIREVRALINTYGMATDDIRVHDMGAAFWRGLSGNEQLSRADRMYEAYSTGDTEYGDEIFSRYGDDKKAAQAMAKEVKDAYIAGDLKAKKAEELLEKYADKDPDDAKASVKEWSAKRDTGIAYGDIKDSFLGRKINGEKAVDMIVTYGGEERKDAVKIVNGWVWEHQKGWKRSEVSDAYKSGKAGKKLAKQVLMEDYDLTSDEADQQITAYDWENQGYGDSVSRACVREYYDPENGLSQAIPARKWVAAYKIHGSDDITAEKDDDGKSISNSRAKKVIEKIGKMSGLTWEQKFLICDAFYKKNVVYKYLTK